MAGYDPMQAISEGSNFLQNQMDESRKNVAMDALVKQYGPTAGDPTRAAALQQNAFAAQVDPLKVTQEQQAVASGQAQLDKTHLEAQQQAELRAALALKAAVDQGQPMDAAFDTIVAPNASTLGLKPEEAAALRTHLMTNPQTLDAMIQAVQGQAKPTGSPQMYQNPDGTTGVGMFNDRGGFTPAKLPEGAQPISPVTGAPQPVQLSDGSWGYAQHDKLGHIFITRLDGTPVQGVNALTKEQQANTGAYRASVYGNNSQFGAAPGAAPPGSVGGVPTSSAGAVGPGQITPKFWKTFARPGESISNVGDNIAVANRGIDYYMSQYKDPARTAVAYYSGPQNVAPPGSSTPYKQDVPARGGNGPPTSGYVSQVMGRMQHGLSINQAILQQESGNARQQAQRGGPASFDNLPPKGRVAAVSAAQGIVNGSQQLASIDDQLHNIDKLVSPLSIGLGSLTAPVPGTPASNLHAALTTLRSQGLTSWLQSLKNASGNTGIGRVLQSEATAAMNSFGALEQSQSEDQFRYHLGIFKQRVHQLQSNAEASFKAQYGVDPYAALGVQQSHASAASPGGQVFNYVNGKLVPG